LLLSLLVVLLRRLPTAALLPAIAVKDVAVGALFPRVRLIPNSHVRQVRARVIVRVEDYIVDREEATNAEHDLKIVGGRRSREWRGEATREEGGERMGRRN
jgi:hypothetical protein